jgi:hypothetical protein
MAAPLPFFPGRHELVNYVKVLAKKLLALLRGGAEVVLKVDEPRGNHIGERRANRGGVVALEHWPNAVG